MTTSSPSLTSGSREDFGESHLLYASCLPLSRPRASGGPARSATERSRRPLRRRRGARRPGRGQARRPRLHGRARARRRGPRDGRRPATPRSAASTSRARRSASTSSTSSTPPSVSAEELKAMMDAGERLVVLDSRPMDEFRVMSIPGGGLLPRGGARAPGGRRRAGPRDAGGGELRGPHPEHHRRSVPHQRGHPEPGDRASKRHHGLAPRGLRARPRSRRPAAPARRRLARGVGAGRRSGLADRFGVEYADAAGPRRLAERGGRALALHLRRSEPRGVPRRPPRGRGPRRGRAARAGDRRVRRYPRGAHRPRRRRRGAGDPHRVLAPPDGVGGIRGAGRPRGGGARLRPPVPRFRPRAPLPPA